ncbi:MAG: hypothetical protein HY791_10975 [Deltaproteobacteria bacterium]|nr:hypothetical protein [Deltaproteobacteria bacterium]
MKERRVAAVPVLVLILAMSCESDRDRSRATPANRRDATTGDGSSRPAGDATRLQDGSEIFDSGSRDVGILDSTASDARADDSGVSDAGGAAIPFCVRGCSTAADCSSGSPAYDADNYECQTGVCVYSGCRSDDECRQSFASSAFVCRPSGSTSFCVESCSTAADCATTSAAYDEDNYECRNQSCVYLGCHDDVECQSSFQNTSYGCLKAELPPGAPLPDASRICTLRCSVSMDCETASAAFDADNYECRSGACSYVGCNDDAECQASFSSPLYVCR